MPRWSITAEALESALNILLRFRRLQHDLDALWPLGRKRVELVVANYVLPAAAARRC